MYGNPLSAPIPKKARSSLMLMDKHHPNIVLVTLICIKLATVSRADIYISPNKLMPWSAFLHQDTPPEQLLKEVIKLPTEMEL
ncbi:hypothetical protein DSO57_1016513 [Entomophthora muscae]|uniref:Uncharacterized protein n=1 Tax=Entomophthora muscae TaxID=34485 RepID=A0ACC2UQL7_9FUNG|nr:hypothetical protein DSO57_1016513 [Entomophthora muscae]